MGVSGDQLEVLGSPSGEPTLVLDPSNEEPRFRVAGGTAGAARSALETARGAQREWSGLSAIERGERLHAVAREVRADERLVALAASDVGKPVAEGRAEVERAARIFEYYAGLGGAASGELYEDAGGAQVRVVRRPRGVALLITPWNFPVAIPAWKLAPALQAGNAVLLKPSTPATRVALALVEAVARAGVPPDCAQVVAGGSATARALIDSAPDIISFTGSTRVGQSIHERVAGRMIPVQLEMGGKNATYVSGAADPREAARIALIGAMGYAGQKCTATSRVYVDAAIEDALASELESQAAELPVGDPRERETVVGPLISAAARDRALTKVEEARGRGVELVFGGSSPARPGFFLTPTVMRGGDAQDPLYSEELFAPVLGVQPVSGVDQALDRIDAVEYGLVAGIVSPLRDEVERFASEVDAGVVRINAPTTGLEPHVPFGGLKASSFGPREQGVAGLEAFRDSKTIYG